MLDTHDPFDDVDDEVIESDDVSEDMEDLSEDTDYESDGDASDSNNQQEELSSEGNNRLQISKNLLEQAQQIKFGEAGDCWWCAGTGVETWPSGAVTKCSHCGGTGIGS